MANFFSAPVHMLNKPHFYLLLLTIFLTGTDVVVNGIPTKFSTDQAAVYNDAYGMTWELSDDDSLFANAQPNHKIISKSVSEVTGEQTEPDDADQAFFSVLRRERGKDDASKEVPRRGAESVLQMEAEDEQKKSEQDSVEIEDEMLQEIIAMRRDAKNLRIRNSSELHIDNHNDSSKEEIRKGKSNANKASSMDYLPKVLVLQKPFHFHIPIVPGGLGKRTNSSLQREDEAVAGSNHTGIQQGPRKGKTKRTKRWKTHGRHAHKHAEDVTEEEFYGNDDQRNLTVRNPDPERLEEVTGIPSLDPSANLNQERTVEKEDIEAEASQSEPQEHDKAADEKSDVDQLIDQYPNLMPSVNRKRHSHKHNSGLDLLEDENHDHLVSVDFPTAPASEAENQLKSKRATGDKKNVKKVIFSQDVVDSILGHEDDFLNYQNKIRHQAKKLGLNPEDIFQAVVYGTMPSNSSTTSNIENHDSHQRRQQFQKLFLEALEDSLESQNPNDTNFPMQKGGNSVHNQKRYNAYMKILKRNKRGIKSWLRSVFKRNDATTSTTPIPTTKAPKHKPRRKLAHSRNVNVYRVEVDKYGDSEVDMLLPKALRRSTYLKNRDNIKEKLKEEEEFEEEYAKSEEKERKLRDEDDSKRRRRRATIDNEDLPEIQLSKMYSIDEMILINNMIINVVKFRCEKNYAKKPFLIDTLENFRTITEEVIEASSLPDYLSVQRLSNQLLACTKWLSKPGKQAPNTGEETTGSNNENITDSSVSTSYYRRLRRTKRVRREEESSIRFEEVISTSTSTPMTNFDDITAERSFINSIQGFLKLHFRFYKLVLASCQPFVEKELLHDSILHLLNEFFNPPFPLPRREELQQFFERYPIDMNGLEKVFNDC